MKAKYTPAEGTRKKIHLKSMAQSEESDKHDLTKVSKFNGRILRSRQYKRTLADNRPLKRLFTPEIKRHLKSWLVRRRENPYPNREEKIQLAAQTGLTYIQICNWFANWRRKLKNSGKHINKFTWSMLIKSYNDQALGNVEHLSISSDDSIWEESDFDQINQNQIRQISSPNHPVDHCYTFSKTEVQNSPETKNFSDQTSKSECLPQCFQISSTTDFLLESQTRIKNVKQTNFLKKSRLLSDKIVNRRADNKHKKSIRDKNWNYRKMIDDLRAATSNNILRTTKCRFESDSLLTKWKKSAALFQPSNKTYSNTSCVQKRSRNFQRKFENFHGKEELDAAEALTFLSRASTNNL